MVIKYIIRKRLICSSFQKVISQDRQGNLTLGDDVDGDETTTAAPDASSITHSLSPEDERRICMCHLFGTLSSR
jgi:hypothetical protein